MTPPRIARSSLGLAAALATTIAAGPLAAQGLSEGVGEIGLSFGLNDVVNSYPDFQRSGNYGFGGVEGSYSFGVAPGMLLGFDASWRADAAASDADFDFFGAPEGQAVLAARALWDLGPDTRLGGFVAYGTMRNQQLVDPALGFRDFDYWLYGIEARHFLSDDLLVFGQLGLGDDDGGDGLTIDGVPLNNGEGFNSGRVVRLGATWFAGDRSAFTADIEYATADPYVDGTDAGEFFGVTLGGETRISAAMPLFATYALQSNWLDATTQGSSVRETSVGIGIRYVFGAETPREAARAGRSIGTPDLPARASVWTIFNDD
jgi:hypothetical protein